MYRTLNSVLLLILYTVLLLQDKVNSQVDEDINLSCRELSVMQCIGTPGCIWIGHYLNVNGDDIVNESGCKEL